MENTLDAYLSILKAEGFKLTPKRKSVISLFIKERRILAPQDVHQKLKAVITPLGLPTIYRILEELASIGILVPVVSDDRLLSYALCGKPQEHHHHFVCRKCHKVEEVDYCNFKAISNLIAKKLGGLVERHSLNIEGLCVRCK
ncbi:MAG: transcriptional repressor [Candidatus Omnitrophica bacterium]|nr:transcriptional repressor [Candidatus Omnitrophota bacterium]